MNIDLYCNSYHCDNVDMENVRNIIFVGRSRTGKTTLIEVLKNKDYNPGLMSLIRGTKDVTLHSFNISDTDLHFNIMDTPGLFEHTLNISDKRTNEIILDIIKKCIDLEISQINHVYFVMSIQHGLSDEDLKAFELFSDLFVGMEDKLSIIISFAQHLSTKQEYDHYINQFESVSDLQPMYDKIKGRIFFLGAVQKGAMYDTQELKKNVYSQREKLLKHIIKQNTSYNVNELKVYKVYEKTLSLMDKLIKKWINCEERKCNNKRKKQGL